MVSWGPFNKTVYQSSVMQPETSLCYYKISGTDILFTIYDHYRIMKCCLLWPDILIHTLARAVGLLGISPFRSKFSYMFCSGTSWFAVFPASNINFFTVHLLSDHYFCFGTTHVHIHTYTHMGVLIKSPAGPSDPPGKLSFRPFFSFPGCFPSMALPY